MCPDINETNNRKNDFSRIMFLEECHEVKAVIIQA